MGGRNSVLQTVAAKPLSHYKARLSPYDHTSVERFNVPDEKVSWSVSWPEYDPVDFTAEKILKMPPYADKDFTDLKIPQPKWNELDGLINRQSHTGDYQIDEVRHVSINPVGRTGMVGRGILGKWGPNHAADPIVTRWKAEENGARVLHPETCKPILQFISIQRRGSLEWAIPGGMVDAGESVSVTLKREFSEETMNTLEASPEERAAIEKDVSDLFKNGGEEVYRGYVDDPRNTDNCWMETIAMNFHDEEGKSVAKFELHAGDDAGGVQWRDLDHRLELFASHTEFLEKVARLRDSHW